MSSAATNFRRAGRWVAELCLWLSVPACSNDPEMVDRPPIFDSGSQAAQAGDASSFSPGRNDAGLSAPGATGANGQDAGTTIAGGADAGGQAPIFDASTSGPTGEAGTAPLTDAEVPAVDAMMPATCDKDLTPQAGQDECTAPLKPGDDRLCEKSIGGAMRQFYIYASPAFNPCAPATLIMDLHGLSESAEVHTGKVGFNLSGQMYPSGYGSGWRMAIQKDNAIVVTPQGLNNSWSPDSDVPFVNEAADMVEAIADIDPEHEYVTGISMGGMMTVATGCDDASRWRGMSPVAMLSQSCSGLSKPTPVMSFHSMTDQLTSYSDDRSLMQKIADFNHCKEGPSPSTSYGGPDTSSDPVCYVTPNGVGDPDAPDPYHVPLQPCPSSAPVTSCVEWTQCDDGVEVVFCTVAASSQPIGGHILYNNDTQLDLAEVAWPFFKKFWN